MSYKYDDFIFVLQPIWYIQPIIWWHAFCPPGFCLSFSSFDMEDLPEQDEENMDEYLEVNSPEPPEPVEPDDTLQTDSQSSQLHPEQDMPHVFKVGASQSAC